MVLLTELYPPAVGGSAVLLRETYERISGPSLMVVTETQHADADPRPHVHGHPVATPSWGLVSPRAFRHHWRTASAVRRPAVRRTVVHCARALPEGLAAWLAYRTGGPPYICWSHGEDLITARSSREYEFLTTRVLRAARFAIANSRNTASLIRGFGVPDERIPIVYPGVNPDTFRPAVDGREMRARLGLGPEHVMVLSIGRLQRRKGHDMVLRSLARVRAHVPLVRYVVAGDGEERAYLEQVARDAGVADLVQMLGAVPSGDLPLLYSACDIFAMPNRVEQGDIEGFGIVFLEAASSARPAIGGNSGGVPEAIVDGETGMLVSGTDANELAERIVQLGTDPFLRRRLGLAGRARVLSGFTWERTAEAVARLHAEALNRRAD